MNRSLLPFFALFFVVFPVLGQQFGGSVGVHNSTILAGDGQSQTHPGVVYVYQQDESGLWQTTDRITAPIGATNASSKPKADGFGRAIAIYENTLLVGAPSINSAFMYRFEGSGWKHVATLQNDEDGFGGAVALSNRLAAVSREGTTDVPGKVWIYRSAENGQSWVEEHVHTEEFDEGGSLLGTSLAIMGDFVFAGMPGSGGGAGSVLVLQPDVDGSWINKGAVPEIDSRSGDEAGRVLATNHSRLAVGAPGFGNRSGTVWMLTFENGKFALESRLSHFAPNRNDQFGSSIALSDSEVWVGSPGEGGRDGFGAIHKFDLGEKGDVLSTSKVFLTDLKPGSGAGTAVAFNKNVAAVGASGIDNRAGGVIPFLYSNESWKQGNTVFDDTEGYTSISGELVECENDLAGDFPCKDVDLTSFVSMEDLGADRGIRTNDLWGWEDPETGREYAIVGLSNATSFVDVTDVYNPRHLGILPMPPTANISVWRDMKVYKDHAYIVSDGAGQHGMQVFDLRQLRNITTPITFTETYLYPEIYSAHNIVINEETGFGYSVGSSSGGETCGGGLHMIDLKDPARPVFAGCFSDGESGRRGTGYSHDAQCVVYRGPDSDYVGHEICLGSNETALSIADVTDKTKPYSISIASYPSVAYAHQGWLTDDHRYFYLNDELDEAGKLVEGTRTLIWDLTDLDEPVLAGEFIATTTETDHNLYVKGDLMYQSNTAAGLRILDISNPEKPFETAYFDTSPVGGRGVSWSNYPYFKSGSIVVTGGHYGLFLLKKKEADL